MAANSSSQTAEFLSDHPSDATRIRQIQEWMPEALQYYNAKQKAASKATSTKKSSSKTSTTKTQKTFHVSSKK